MIRRFSPSLTRLGTDGQRPLSGGGTGAPLILIGRELLLFLHLDANAIPAKQRKGFVALEVRRAAPFLDPEHDLIWFGNHAAVWYWSRERIHQLLQMPIDRKRLKAEPCYYGTITESDAVELLALQTQPTDTDAAPAGFEARLWRQGHMVSSRWWPDIPTDAQWRSYLRGGGMDASLLRPEPEPAILRKQPITGAAQAGVLAGQLRNQWKLLLTALCALLLMLYAWQVGGAVRATYEASRIETRITSLEKRLDKIISARNRADDATAHIESLLALRPPASQTRLLAEVKRITPGTDWQLLSWQQPGPETIEATLKGSNLDISAIVTAWEQSPLLQDVTPSTGSRINEPKLQAKLTPLAEQSP